MGAAEQARKAHVGLPTSRGGRGPRGRASKGLGATSAGGGMKLASKLGASKLGKPEEFFDF